MRLLIVAAIAFTGCWCGAARADAFCLDDWYRKTAALVQSLIEGGVPKDRDVIKAPADVDRQMALAPPAPGGAMRVIKPPAAPMQR